MKEIIQREANYYKGVSEGLGRALEIIRISEAQNDEENGTGREDGLPQPNENNV